MTTPELKPCPFCGEKVTRLNDDENVSVMRDYYCPGCKVSVAWLQTAPGRTDQFWNRRSDQARLLARIEELEREREKAATCPECGDTGEIVLGEPEGRHERVCCRSALRLPASLLEAGQASAPAGLRGVQATAPMARNS